MRTKNLLKNTLLPLSLLATTLSANAAQTVENVNPKAVEKFIDEQVSEYDFDRETLKNWLAEAKKNQQVLDAIQRPWEAKPWYQYYPIFLTEKRLDRGVKFWQQHQDTLASAENEFGVPAEVIVAIIGIETFYGSYLGKYPVLDSLYTLAFHYPPRSSFFRSELSEYLRLARAENWQVTEQVGSYAGAMGLGQFISSSYRHYAVDFDHDGQRNILDNPVDAIGSVANYFAEHRWQADAPIATQPDQQQDWSQVASSGMKPDTTVAELRKKGFNIDNQYPGSMPVKVLQFETEDGHEYWLGFDNFYAITRYNHSPLYAMVAYQLSQQLKHEMNNSQ
ncbi:lytic murein transglycosylase B [Idiomarina seosinensis]|uniref:Lytic murein transglycosylase B n=1 Tax=Idiomarina seosinensis TaxID=281739 RepID=A0A432ZH16_9GAMM|nr:lytic murein transglycosylase B [Idiomarina seosinensis]RUO77219.1 lytic murein transglycosylase B [Idiomarina seosinensis]